jgi:hypothetical protein
MSIAEPKPSNKERKLAVVTDASADQDGMDIDADEPVTKRKAKPGPKPKQPHGRPAKNAATGSVKQSKSFSPSACHPPFDE